MSSIDNNYRHELDGLRALAVIAVIINHFDHRLLQSGYLGVDIFFVISGYVITGSLLHQKFDSFKDFISQFYAKRIKRLLPALITVVLLTGLITIILIEPSNLSIKTGLFALVGFSNNLLYHAAIDYFSISTKLNTLTHTWSLGVEEQFYFVYPIILWIIFGYGKRLRRQKRILLYVIGCLSVLSLSLFIYTYTDEQPFSYFIVLCRFWELGVGCITYVFITSDWFSKRNIELNATFVLLILLSSLFIPESYHIVNTINIVVLTSLLIIFIQPKHLSFKLFTHKYSIYIGLISYSLYLWHWPIISISLWTTGVDESTYIWQVPLMLILSILTHKYIEKPLRKAKWSLKNQNTIIIGITSSLLAISILLVVFLFKDKICVRKSPWENTSTFVSQLPCNLPNVEDPITHCLYSPNTNKNVIYIIGDSHAGNLVVSIQRAVSNKMTVKYLTDKSLINSIFRSKNTVKNEYQSRLDFFSKNLKKGDIVIFSISRDRLYGDFDNYPNNRPSLLKKRQELLAIKLKKLGELIAKKKSIFFLVDDIPKLCSDFSMKLRQKPQDPCSIKKEISLKDRQPLTDIYLSLINNSIKYIDPHPVLCPDKTCHTVLNKKLLYSDRSPHISEMSKDVLTDFFALVFEEHSDTSNAYEK